MFFLLLPRLPWRLRLLRPSRLTGRRARQPLQKSRGRLLAFYPTGALWLPAAAISSMGKRFTARASMPESWTASGRRSASCRASSPRACRARRRRGFSVREERTGRRCSTTPSCLSLKTARSASRRFRFPCPLRSRWARRRRTVRRCTSSRPIMFSSPISARRAPTSRGACFRCHVLRRVRRWSPPFRTATRRRSCSSSTAAMTPRQESRCTTAGGLSFRRST